MSVIVPYNEDASELVEQLAYTPYPASTLRKLQIYTVNIYEPEFQAINLKGAIDMIADTYAVLNDMDYYNEKTGINIPTKDGGEAIFYD